MSQGVAIVTGANRGLGFEISQQLAVAGLHVVMTSRDEAVGREAHHTLLSRGLPVSHYRLDVSQTDSIDALVDVVVAEHGGVDVLVNNAGVAFDGFDAEVARLTVDTNYFGPLRMYDAFAASLRPGARVVMLSSGMGDRSSLASELEAVFRAPMSREGLSGWMRRFVEDVVAGRHERAGWPSSAYRVSKVGLNKLTEILAAETADDPRRLKINAACPGWVRTRMGGAQAPRSVESGAETPVFLATLGGDGPTGGLFRDCAPAAW